MKLLQIIKAPYYGFNYMTRGAVNSFNALRAARLRNSSKHATRLRKAHKAKKQAKLKAKPVEYKPVNESQLKQLLETKASVRGIKYVDKVIETQDFDGKKFFDCDFSGVEFICDKSCKLEFVDSNLQGATFMSLLDCEGKINFWNCNLPNSHFDFALQEIPINIDSSNLNNMTFWGFMDDSYISNSTAIAANFWNSRFDDTYLLENDMRSANFNCANLSKARLFKNNFREASFIGTDFGSVDLESSDFAAADMRLARFNPARIDPAKMNGVLLCGMALPESVDYVDNLSSKDLDKLSKDYEGFLKKFTTKSSILKSMLNVGAVEKKDFANSDLSHLDFRRIYVPAGTSFAGVNFRNTGFTNSVFAYVDFKHANFKEVTLDQTIFDRSDFRAVSFKDVCFGTEVSMQGANLDGADLSNIDIVDWGTFNISGASLVAANLENAFFGADLTLTDTHRIDPDFDPINDYPAYKHHPVTDLRRANLRGVKFVFPEEYPLRLDNFDFSGADLTGSSFENVFIGYGNHFIGTDFSNASFKNVKVANTREGFENVFPYNSRSFMMLANFAWANFENVDFSRVFNCFLDVTAVACGEAQIDPDDYIHIYENPYFTNFDFSGLDLRALDFSPYDVVVFEDCNFDGANLEGVDLSNVCFDDCSMKFADLRGTNVFDTLHETGNYSSMIYMRGARLDEKDQEIFKSKNYNSSQFRFADNKTKFKMIGSDLSHRDLSRMNLSEQDMRGVNLEKSSLQETDLNGAMLAGANLTRANFDKAKLDGVKIYNAVGVHPMLKAKLEGGETAEIDRDRRMGY